MNEKPKGSRMCFQLSGSRRGASVALQKATSTGKPLNSCQAACPSYLS